MARVEDIGWGSYRQYEGPFYRGVTPFVLPASPSWADKVLAVSSSTEGGKYDAYNGYDACICTSGLIQWCERGMYGVSNMLGHAASEGGFALLRPLDDVLGKHSIGFSRNAKGRFRFHGKQFGGEVDTEYEQRQLFLLHSDGTKGTWDDESKRYAKEWAAAISTVWESPAATKLQTEYTAQRKRGFCLPFARKLVDGAPPTDVGQAFQAAYLSFAGNNPTWANEALQHAVEKEGANPYEFNGLVAVLRSLTFHKGIRIYPGRYDKIRPVLEKLWNLNLPDFADELKTFQGGAAFWDPKEIQQALLALGFDLGPAKDDGNWGKKSKEAFLTFELQHGLPGDGVIDEASAAALEKAMEQKGITQLSDHVS